MNLAIVNKSWQIHVNYQKIPFRTIWTEYPDITALYTTNGIAHTVCNPDGTPRYTLPVLYDPNTGLYISESLNTANYVEKTYSLKSHGNNIPSVFPARTEGLHVAVSNLFMISVVMPNFPIIAVTIGEGLNSRSLDFYRIPRGKNHKQDTRGGSFESSDRRSTLGWFQTSNGEIRCILSDGWSSGRAFHNGKGFIMDWFVSRRLPDSIQRCLGWGWQKVGGIEEME